MGWLENVSTFVRIVEAGGIGSAARQLGLTRSVISRRLSKLEESLETQLIQRTTRAWTLTEAGERYYDEAKDILQKVESLNSSVIANSSSKLTGHIRIAAPLSFGMNYLNTVLEQFCREHDQLKYQIDLSDRHVNLIEEGYDLAIRIGELKDSSLRGRSLGTVTHSLVVSPQYTIEHGVPKTANELSNHKFLRFNLAVHQSANQSLSLQDSNGEKIMVKTNNLIESNSADYLKYLCVKGLGISYLPSFLVKQELEEGMLLPVLESYQLPKLTLSALYPNTRYLSASARQLIDFVSDECIKSLS